MPARRRELLRSARPLASARAAALVALVAAMSAGPVAFGQSARRALEPEPATLAIDGPIGAEVRVDGTLVGTTPLPSPLEVMPGPHFVTVTMDGHESYARNLRVARGEHLELYADLAVTDQRIAAGLIIGAGGAGLAAGIVLGVLSVVEQRRASDILEQAGDGALGVEDQREHDSALAAADDYRVASGAVTGISLALFVVGGVLFVLDEPAVPAGADDGRAGPEPAESAGASRLLLSAEPELGPSYGGATFRLRF